MKTKKSTKQRSQVINWRQVNRTLLTEIGKDITETTHQAIAQTISFYLDLINDPRFKDNEFVQIEKKGCRSYEISANSSDISISFNIDWKGGKP